MTLTTLARLAIKLLIREWRAGSLTVMATALLIAITSHTTIGFFTERLSNAMEAKATHLLGADLVIKSPSAVSPELLDGYVKNNTDNLNIAHTIEFTTIAIAGDELKLSSVKAVSNNYPLKGFMRTSRTLFGEEFTTTDSPAVGEVWVEHRVLSSLNINIGNTIDIGDTALTVSRVLTFEPDRSGAFYALAPRIIMNLNDLAKAGIVQQGSRVDYRYLIEGSPGSIKAYRDWIKPQLTPSQSVLDIHNERPAVSSSLVRAESYMKLSGLVAILLAAVAIAMSARLYAESHYDTSALIRCLGGRQNDVLFIFVLQLSILAFFSGVIGSIFGWISQSFIAFIIQDMLPESFPQASLTSAWTGLALSFIVLFGFSLPTLLRLRQVSPLRVLRKNLEPSSLSGTIIYLATFIFVSLLIFVYTQDIKLTTASLIGGATIALFGFIIVALLFILLNKLNQHFPLIIKSGIRNLIRRKNETRWQTLAFGITLMAMTLVIIIRSDLIDTWQSQLPEDIPNHFVMNILPGDVKAFEEFLTENKITASNLYPVSRGRLTHINNIAVKSSVTKEEESNEALNRELNLTEAKAIQKDNRLVQGEWWPPRDISDNSVSKQSFSAQTKPKVSVEARLAKKLNIELNDELTFFIGSRSLKASVSSIRTVKWDSFKPNFYMVFEPGSLNSYPTTNLTSFYLPAQKRKVLNSMLRQFPAITLLEVGAILQQIKSILAQVTLAVEIVLSFVLFAGFAVTFAALQSTLSQRLHEGALMRTLGASKRQIRINQWVEYAMMGSLSGLIAVAGTEVVLWALYTQVFHLEYRVNFLLMLLLPLTGALVIGLFGIFTSRKVLEESPTLVLRES
ncbi:hypothetical protein A9Q81_11590 [Gammaproteobacteria bacterium 42_54_T18]|nr:hypothetical protein A9Q81_11590 [Gammaproteobacteria bacterium 42_54_T18]